MIVKKILLIQFRADQSRAYEEQCFLRFFSKKKNLKLKIINAFDKKNKSSLLQKITKDARGIILGGSPIFLSEIKKEKIFLEMVERITPFIKYLLKKDIPTLGICFGHQFLAHILGFRIIKDKSQTEKGSFFISLTREGRNDSLFSEIPARFVAQLGHKESLEKLPEGATLLARSQRCKIQAFLYKNNIYGVQFHPELTPEDILERLEIYPDYSQGRQLSSIKRKLKPSPSASKVIENFLTRI